MSKRPTIKDIAALAGVSLGTVHYALSGKTGVSSRTRERVLQIARSVNYSPNSGAAALKRKPVTIAAAFPGPSEDNRYFYADVWAGLRAMFNTARDLNINYVEVPYYDGFNNQADELARLSENTCPDGLISVGYTDNRGKMSLSRFIETNVPVVLVANDIVHSERLCCVRPNYLVTGRMLAEFITRQIPPGAPVLVCAGDVLVPSHYLIVQGFDSYFSDNGLTNPVYKVHSDADKEKTLKNFEHALSKNTPAACVCVNARGSVLMAQALAATGLAGKITAVGSDLFEENFNALQNGVFTSLLNKNGFMQAYIAAKCIIDYLVRDIKPPNDSIYVGSEIVFQSNAAMYRDGSSRLIL
jgi:LacI family transcriptional regulator